MSLYCTLQGVWLLEVSNIHSPKISPKQPQLVSWDLLQRYYSCPYELISADGLSPRLGSGFSMCHHSWYWPFLSLIHHLSHYTHLSFCSIPPSHSLHGLTSTGGGGRALSVHLHRPKTLSGCIVAPRVSRKCLPLAPCLSSISHEYDLKTTESYPGTKFWWHKYFQIHAENLFSKTKMSAKKNDRLETKPSVS